MTDSTSLQLTVSSLEQTRRLGRQIAAALRPGLTIGFYGELGAGKTHLVKAICDGLGIDPDTVNSPTFVIMQSYMDGRIPVHHFDTYRLGDADEFLAIGADEFLNDANAVCLIEWAERVEDVLPGDVLKISLRATGPQSRDLQLVASGELSQSVMNALK